MSRTFKQALAEMNAERQVAWEVLQRLLWYARMQMEKEDAKELFCK